MKNIAIPILCSLISAFAAVAIYRSFLPEPQVFVRENPPAAISATLYEIPNAEQSLVTEETTIGATSILPSFVSAAERVTKAVVNIKSEERPRGIYWLGKSNSISTGSGVIISADGYIVTNNHVIENGNRFAVTLADKRDYEANLVGVDPSTDLALLKIEAENLPFAYFGDSDSLRVGEWVLAVGNPFNLESTVTAGIVSAKGRNIDILEGEYSIESFIQTDAAVNPGNSGGALVNTSGQLVGINTAIITLSGRYEGYSFAVPSKLVRKVIDDLRTYGAVQRGILGVGIGELTGRQAANLGLPSVEGVYVNRVTPNSGADEGGIRRGDVILGINGTKVRTVPELQEIVARFHPGSVLKIEYFRKGKTNTTSVTLRNQANAATIQEVFKDGVLRELGMEIRNLNMEEINKFGKDGVYVVSIYRYSTIEKTEMKPSYIITHINNQRIYSAEELISELEKAEKEVFLEGYYEDYEGEYYYQFD
ncbi:MAG: trypsin-like peptidase domain-containing protein, partial [Bacteroidota bacterium]